MRMDADGIGGELRNLSQKCPERGREWFEGMKRGWEGLLTRVS